MSIVIPFGNLRRNERCTMLQNQPKVTVTMTLDDRTSIQQALSYMATIEARNGETNFSEELTRLCKVLSTETIKEPS